jgi:hypothetical protein
MPERSGSSGDEFGAASSAARLGVIISKTHPVLGHLVEIGCLERGYLERTGS